MTLFSMESTAPLDLTQEHNEPAQGVGVHKLLHILLVCVGLVVKRGEIFFELGAVHPFGEIIGIQQIRPLITADAFQRVAEQAVVLEGLPPPMRVHRFQYYFIQRRVIF